MAAAIAAWLVVDAFSGASGPKRALPWRNLTAEAGGLVLPSGISKVFYTRGDLASFIHESKGKRVPHVDFSRERAVVVTIGPRTTTAYALRVAGVSEQDDRVTLAIERQNATLAHPGRPQLTFPHVLIALPRKGGSVHVRWLRG